MINMAYKESTEYLVSEDILKLSKVFTTYDNETMFFYDRGYFTTIGETKTKEIIQEILQDKTTNTIVNEILGHIKRKTYIDREEFDTAEKKYIPVRNGVYDIEEKKLKPHLWNYMFTHRIPIEYNPKQKQCPKIIEFLKQILPKEQVRTCLEMIAYGMYRGNPLQKAFMLVGNGSNGKSTLINVLNYFIGEENTSHIEFQELEENKFATANLFGKLVNNFADLPDRALKGTGTFKSLTGCDRIRGEQKFKSPFFFRPYAKLVFSANLVPRTNDDSDAFYRRWIILQFPNQFVGPVDKKDLINLLTTRKEQEGLLYICLNILPALLKRGKFSSTQSIESIREQYTRLSDPVGSFILDRIMSDTESFIPKKALYNKFLDYCKKNHYPFVSEKTFSMVLQKNMRVAEIRTQVLGERVNCWTGIKYRAIDEKDKICINYD